MSKAVNRKNPPRMIFQPTEENYKKIQEILSRSKFVSLSDFMNLLTKKQQEIPHL